MFQSIETMQKNILYLTYRMDMLIKRYDKVETDKSLQKQVDDFYPVHPEDTHDED